MCSMSSDRLEFIFLISIFQSWINEIQNSSFRNLAHFSGLNFPVLGRTCGFERSRHLAATPWFPPRGCCKFACVTFLFVVHLTQNTYFLRWFLIWFRERKSAFCVCIVPRFFNKSIQYTFVFSLPIFLYCLFLLWQLRVGRNECSGSKKIKYIWTP